MLGERDAEVLVEVRDDLGVAAGLEPVPAARERCADVSVVVELAVLNGPDAPVLVGERLVTALDVDDAQATDAECDAVGGVGAAVVRPAMGHRVRHPVEDPRREHRARLAPQLNDSADPAHCATNGIRRSVSTATPDRPERFRHPLTDRLALRSQVLREVLAEVVPEPGHPLDPARGLGLPCKRLGEPLAVLDDGHEPVRLETACEL